MKCAKCGTAMTAQSENTIYLSDFFFEESDIFR